MSCPFQIHTSLNSFTPYCLHCVFSDYNPSPIHIHIPICADPCRKDLCSGDHLHLYKRHHHRVTTVCSSLLFIVSTTKSVALMRLYVLYLLMSRDTPIFCRRGWPKLIGEDEQFLFILFYSIRIWNRNVKQYVLCLFYSCYEMRYILLLFYFIMFHSVWWLLKSVLFCLEIYFLNK